LPFQLSPGVAVIEKDFTSIVPAVATASGAFAGVFPWGPVMSPVRISSENELVRLFGKPETANAVSFFTAANFLSYTNNLLVNRIDTEGHLNATSDAGAIKILNEDDYDLNWSDGMGGVGQFAAKYPGSLGNSIAVHICSTASDFATWAYKGEFDSAPGTSDYAAGASGSKDEMHVLIVDADGRWTGTPGQLLEKYAFLSKASDAKKADGSTNFYKNVLNSQSQYVWWMDYPDGTNWGDTAVTTEFDEEAVIASTLVGGVRDRQGCCLS